MSASVRIFVGYPYLLFSVDAVSKYFWPEGLFASCSLSVAQCYTSFCTPAVHFKRFTTTSKLFCILLMARKTEMTHMVQSFCRLLVFKG